MTMTSIAIGCEGSDLVLEQLNRHLEGCRLLACPTEPPDRRSDGTKAGDQSRAVGINPATRASEHESANPIWCLRQAANPAVAQGN
ncbi:MAG: hypothetical protein V9G15_04095 [Dermatophilaceae bacterium]